MNNGGDKDGKNSKNLRILTAREKEFAGPFLNESAPSFTDWTCYMFPIFACYNGTTFEYLPFIEFINLRGNFSKIPQYSTILPGLYYLGKSAVMAGGMIFFDYLSDGKLVRASTYENAPFWYITYLLWMNIEVESHLLFCGFASQECTMVVSGFGYRPAGVKKETSQGTIELPQTYNSHPTVNYRGIWSSYDFSNFGANWNIQIHNWLKYYVMIRWMDRSTFKKT